MEKSSKCISVEARFGRILRGWDAYEGHKYLHPESTLTEEEYYDYVLRTPFEKGSGEHSAIQINPDAPNIADGPYASAFGYNTSASGPYSHASGRETKATGVCSHTEGYQNRSSGNNAHSEGAENLAAGDCSHAEGVRGTADAPNSHVEGDGGVATGESSHVEGVENTASGRAAHAEGGYTQAIANLSHAEGDSTVANGNASHAEGLDTSSVGAHSHAEGGLTRAGGSSSHAEGYLTKALGEGSHAEGIENEATGRASHVEGSLNKVTGNLAHGEGRGVESSGLYAHAEGDGTIASGKAAHSEGCKTIASGPYTHSGGLNATSSGEASFSHGVNTVATNRGEAVFGRNNIPDKTGKSLFQVGGGTASDPRTLFQIDDDGTVHLILNGKGTKLHEALRFVRYDDPQPLTIQEQKQARENIGAPGSEDVQAPLKVQTMRTGNIRIEGLAGGAREFMPATPSGHPLHDAFLATGGVWTPYDNLPERLKDERSLANGGYWSYRVDQGGLEDITTEEFLEAYMLDPVIATSFPKAGMQSVTYRPYCKITPRFNICNLDCTSTQDYTSCFRGVMDTNRFGYNKMEVLWLGSLQQAFCSNISYLCRFQYALKRINCNFIDVFYCKTTSKTTNAFQYCEALEYLPLMRICCSIDLSTLKSLSNESFLYMINNVEATATNVVLTLHPEAYARAMADEAIAAALEAHTNISLASA